MNKKQVCFVHPFFVCNFFMNVSQIFYNQIGRLRSGWRLLIFLLLFICFGGLFSYAAELVIRLRGVDFAPGSILFLAVNTFVSLAAALSVGWWCGKYLEELPFRALGAWFTKNWLKDFGLGLILGAASLMLAAFIAFVFGGLSFQVNQTHGQSAILLTLGISLLVFILGAASEEVLFRGYMFQTLARANLAWLAILLTSLFFALAHTGNPAASFISTLNTILAGVWFGIAYLKTRTLWLVFGLHLAWNWFQGAIFGMEVSGITSLTTAPLLQEIDAGPVWLTGADYGIEGGIACTAALVISILVIWFSPFIKPTEEMLLLTDRENPQQ